MNNKLFFTAIVLLLGSLSFWSNTPLAAPVDTATARKVALTFMQTRNGFQQLQAEELHLVYTSRDHSDRENCAVFYVFNIREHAFVMIAADDRSTPVLAYSTTSRFDADNLAENTAELLDNYRKLIVSNSRMSETPAENRMMWERLSSGEGLLSTRGTQKTVGPLLQTTWSQSPFYNKFCPYDSNTHTNAVTGCTATAMAQIIKYWRYPAKGFGHCAYTHPKYGFLSVNYEETTYQYDSMPVMLDYNSSESEVNAVARLMSDCGIGVAMNYSPSGSGAAVLLESGKDYCAEYVMHRYMGYVYSSAYSKYKSPSSWVRDVRNDLDNGRPILFAGYQTHEWDGGHAFVCDGYDDMGLYHFNWGWNGYQDGFYLMDSANSFSFYQQAIFGLMPPNRLNQFHLVLGSKLETDKDTIDCDETFNLNVSVLNNGGKPFSGQIRLCMLNAQTKEVLMAFDTVSCLQSPIATNASLNLQFPLRLNHLISTNYLLILYYRDTLSDFSSNDWIMVEEIGDYNNEKVIRFEGGKATASMDSVSEITARTALVSAHVEEGCSEKITLKNIQYKKSSASTFSNLKDTSSGDEIHLLLNNLEPNTSYDVQCHIMVESNGIYNTYTSEKISFVTLDNQAVAAPGSEQLTIFPNPTRGMLHLLLPNAENYRADIYNSMGQKVRSQSCQGPRCDLDANGLPKGLYYIHLQNNIQHFYHQFIME